MAKKKKQKHAAEQSAVSALDVNTEFASRLVDPFENNYLGVLRTQDPLLVERGNEGVEIYRDLKRDGKVFSALQKRTLALVSKPWQIEPVDGVSLADAETLTGILKGFAFDLLCQRLMEAILTGWSIAEIVWTVRDGLVVPERVPQRAPKRFRYVQADNDAAPWLHLLTREHMVRGVPVPERKFIIHRVNEEDDNPYGVGLGLQLYWPVFFKRKGVVAWNKLNDRFGTPTLWGKHPRNASKQEKNTLLDALRAFSSDGCVVTPEGSMIEMLESKLSGNISTQEALCMYMDDWIDSVVLGTEPRAKNGGALAAASKERQDVRMDLVQADSDLLSETLNSTLITWLCEYNKLAPCILSRVIKEEEDLREQAETDKIVSDMGFELSLDQVRARYGEGWEKKAPQKAPLPALNAPTSPHLPDDTKADNAGQEHDNADPADDSAQFAEAAHDAIDAAVADAMADWHEVIQPIADPYLRAIEQAAEEGVSAEEVLKRVSAVLENADTEPLAERLTQLASAARMGANAGGTL